jgi:putative membrane protein
MILNFSKGFLIGIANIIPGVSGGTFALVLGIYDRLINTLSGFNPGIFKNIFKPVQFFKEFKEADGLFLIELGVGAFASIAVLSWVIDYVLKFYPGMTLAFFMGLIIPSISVPYKMIAKKNTGNLLFIIPGILLVLFIYNMKFGAIQLSLPVVFLSGVAAISAMILPGISGSFLLLVLGVYGGVINNIKLFTSSFNMQSFIFLATFGIGCLVGLVLFVRVMKVLLKKSPDQTLYFLIGLVLGSVFVLWPFKDYPVVSPEKIEIGITTSKNIFPGSFKEVGFALLFFCTGIIGAFGMNVLANKRDK